MYLRSILFLLLLATSLMAQKPAADWRTDFKFQQLENRPALEVRYVNGDRDAFEIIAADYQLTGSLLYPNTLIESGNAEPWLYFDIKDQQGNVFSSRNNPGKTRINLYRRGPYYCEIHWFDHVFTNDIGASLPVKAEIVLYCYPDKIKGSIKLFALDKATLASVGVKGKSEKILTAGTMQKDQTQYINFDLFGESKPLNDQAFTLKKGTTPVHYDQRTGAYTIGSETADGFQRQYFEQPNGYEQVSFAVKNDGTPRTLYICHKTLKGEGIVEGGVVLDETGHPLPILVQVSKNFDGEKEERFYNPQDTAFSETFFPLFLEPYEELDISSLHLYQNWGRHMTKHWSSLGFFMDYFHSSTGVTETTCYIPFKFGHKTGISIGDFRAMSQETFWSGQPQHDNVAGHNFLTFFDGKQWNYSEYRGTTYKSTGANWCNVEMEYLSSDGSIRLLLDIWEVPQEDEVRSFFTARYSVLKPVTIDDAKANFRFLDISSAQQSLRYLNYAYTDGSGNTIEKPIDFDLKPFCVKGVELPSENSFASIFGEPKGSNGIMIRSFSSNRGLKPAFSIQQESHIPEPKDTTVNEHPVYTPNLVPGDIRFSLVPSTDRLVLKPGDEIILSGYWLPYGEIDGAETPARDILAYGKDQPRVVAISKGLVLNNLPTTIQVENNEALFTLKGGLNVLPVIATGLTSFRYPALYEKINGNWEYVHHEHNDAFDGMQVFADKDGRFGAVFLIRTKGKDREFRIASGDPFPSIKRIETTLPKQSLKPEIFITNPFENLPVTLTLDNFLFGSPVGWNESSGKSFWYTGKAGDTLTGARITGFESQVAVQYWWQNTLGGLMARSPKFELTVRADLFAGKFRTLIYKGGRLVEVHMNRKTASFPADLMDIGLQPGIIVLHNPDLDYCVALAFKNASSVYFAKNKVGVVLTKQNCPAGRRKVTEGNVYLFKGGPAVLQQLIEQQMPIWNPDKPGALAAVSDREPVHCIGNGKMCIYEKGPDIITAYTGLYSSPSFLRLEWIKGEQSRSQSVRKPGTAVWTHTLQSVGGETGELLDFVDSEKPCFVRLVKTGIPVTFRIKLEKYVQITDNTRRLHAGPNVHARLLTVPPGAVIYQTYVYPRILYSQILTSGQASIHTDTSAGTIDITCGPGESSIYLIGGPEYPEVMVNTRQMLETSTDILLSRTERYWENFTKSRTDFTGVLPENTPSRSKLLSVIDDVAVLLKTQQSIQGAVLAGYPYPLGYVRDQYGVSRGLLALGLQEEAKSILNFYWQIWEKYGYVHNAQAIGIDGVFHIHENDEVESTGYLILQALDLLKATHDEVFMAKITPMLDWAFNIQKKWLVGDMLPFNGDETYVAGGMLPRSALNDGSAEATMLFIESGQKYLDWVAATRRWPASVIEANRALIARVKKVFPDNFLHDGILWTNNPARSALAELPRFRHGVCEAAGGNCLMGKYQGIVWTERNDNGRYVCANCISDGLLPRAEPRQYNLLSVALAPFYMKFSIIPFDQLKPAVIEMVSRKDEPRTVGYDYGFLLHALTVLKQPEALALYEKTLSVADAAGAWAEYYLEDQPYGTRCRPWESAINLEALILYAMDR